MSKLLDLAQRKVATIVPTAHLAEIAEDEYMMALTHAADNPEYFEFFKARAAEGKHVILDNSTVELGEPEDMRTYLTKAIEMGATEVLSPDWLKDKDRTMAALAEFTRLANSMGYKGRIMAVPQGRSHDEWYQCVEEMLEPRFGRPINTLGISRRYTNLNRAKAAFNLAKLFMRRGRYDAKVHLLGCAGLPEKDVAPAIGLPVVQGVDSSLAALFTKCGLYLEAGIKRPEGMIDIVNDRYADVSLLVDNKFMWRMLCVDGEPRRGRF